jgi:hypothetical protein
LPSQLVHHLNHNPSGRYSQSAWSRWQSYSTQTRGQFLLTGSANIPSADFAGLRYLRDKLGARFKAGALIYTGADTLPFGYRLAAVPLSGLWREASV